LPGMPLMIKLNGKLALSCIFITIIAAATFLIFIYPRQPLVKILLYHSISNGAGKDIPAISTGLFGRQMRYFAENGYKTVFLKDVVLMHKQGQKITRKLVVLTFDGGYSDFYQNAYPILKKYKLKAVLFVSTCCIGKDSISWEHLREMKNSGLIEIGSHSHNHLVPTCISLPEAFQEKVISKDILEKGLGERVVSYAYPYGAINRRVRELVQKSGYECAVGIVYRWGEFKIKDVYNLRRIYVSRVSELPFMFRFMLSGYYVPVRALMLRVFNIKSPRDAAKCG